MRGLPEALLGRNSISHTASRYDNRSIHACSPEYCPAPLPHTESNFWLLNNVIFWLLNNVIFSLVVGKEKVDFKTKTFPT